MGLAINPAGTVLALTTPGRLAIVGVDGTNYRELYQSPNIVVNPYRVGWSGNGQYVLFAAIDERGRTRVMRVPAAGGTPEPIQLDAEDISGFEVSPDGTRIAYSARKNATDVWSMELRSALQLR